MNIDSTIIKDLYILKPRFLSDNRGVFIKTYNEKIYNDLGLNNVWQEEYFSKSFKNVIRGMHFQLPPYDHEKIVFCLGGSVIDVMLDLRKNSDTYGKYLSVNLDSDSDYGLYIPKGIAHGFLSLEDNTMMYYRTSTAYKPSHDSGVRWNTFNYNWGINNPIISERDKSFLTFDNFNTPFT